LDTSNRSGLESATIKFVQDGSVIKSRTNIHISQEAPSVEAQSQGGGHGTWYSISLDPKQAGSMTNTDSEDESVSRLGEDDFSVSEKDVENFDASMGQRTTSGDISAQDLPEPDWGDNWEAAAWAETNSSECGSLARSKSVLNYTPESGNYKFDDHSIIAQNVDGAACDGDQFGDRFPCRELPPVTDCDVPESFNTHWYTEDYSYGKSSNELNHSAEFYNTDFPLIAKTNADHEANVWWEGNSLNINATIDHYGTINEAIRFFLKKDTGVKFF